MSIDTIISEIESLSVLELAELVKALEEKFGLSANLSAHRLTTPFGMWFGKIEVSF